MGITEKALETAKDMGTTIYNVNLYQEEVDVDVSMRHIIGKSEETLPMLAKVLWKLYSKPRIWYPRPMCLTHPPPKFVQQSQDFGL